MNAEISEEIKSLTVKVGKYQPYYYAGASLDFNEIHIDNEFGKKVGLGGIILQGLCTMAYVFRAALGESDPGNLKKIKVRFKSPVKPLDEITVSGKITGRENSQTMIDLIAVNQNNEEVITSAQAIVSTLY
jgi:acyl dehydratase